MILWLWWAGLRKEVGLLRPGPRGPKVLRHQMVRWSAGGTEYPDYDEQASGRRWDCSGLGHVARRCFGTKWYDEVPEARSTRDGDTGNEDNSSFARFFKLDKYTMFSFAMTSGLASDSDKFKIIITLRRAQKNHHTLWWFYDYDEQASGRRWDCSGLGHVARRCFGTKWYDEVPGAPSTRDGDTGNEDNSSFARFFKLDKYAMFSFAMTSGLASDSDKFKIIITLRRAQKNHHTLWWFYDYDEQASGRRWDCSGLGHVARRCFGTKWYDEVPGARSTRDGDTGNEDNSSFARFFKLDKYAMFSFAMTSGLASDSDKFKIIITLRRAQKFGDTGPQKNFIFLNNPLTDKFFWKFELNAMGRICPISLKGLSRAKQLRCNSVGCKLKRGKDTHCNSQLNSCCDHQFQIFTKVRYIW